MNTISTLRSISILTAVLIFGIALHAKQGSITRADAALILAEHFHISHTQDPKTLYGLFEHVFPGGYDGKRSISYYQNPLTTEVLIVVLVREAGWDVLRYNQQIAQQVAKYVSPQGFPYYGPAPTPRSIPYVTVALEKGLLTSADLEHLREPITRSEMIVYLKRFDEIQSQVRPLNPFLILNASDITDHQLTDIKPQYNSQLIIVPRGLPRGPLPPQLTNPILDMRGPNLRLFSGPSSLGTGNQDYFPLGALDTTFTVANSVPRSSLVHQGEAIYGIVENASKTANAVGIWGASKSEAANARVWGGFFTANSSEGSDKDAQLIGAEIDVTNDTRPGIAPNASKTGLQVVGIGSAPVTNAIEIIGFDRGVWTNGLSFADHSISENGTFIGFGQTTPAMIGINMSSTPFKRAAILISNNSLCGFRSKSGADAGIYTDDINNGSLVLRSGRDGTRITDNSNSKNLLWIRPNGSIDKASGIVSYYSPYLFGVGLLILTLVLVIGYLVLSIAKLNRAVRELRSYRVVDGSYPTEAGQQAAKANTSRRNPLSVLRNLASY